MINPDDLRRLHHADCVPVDVLAHQFGMTQVEVRKVLKSLGVHERGEKGWLDMPVLHKRRDDQMRLELRIDTHRSHRALLLRLVGEIKWPWSKR